MERESGKRGIVRGVWQKLSALSPGRTPAAADGPDPGGTPDALGVLEQLQAGRRLDYCLYVGPTRTKPAAAGAPDMEGLLAQGFAPLPVVPLDGYRSPLRRLPTDGRLADEAFATLAGDARVLLVVPSAAPETVKRVRWLREHDHLWRAVFFMPDAGALGMIDWAAAWDDAHRAVAAAGVELPPYTAGGWLFRYAIDPPGASGSTVPRAATFRMIVHPNPEKIAKALDAVCGEMSATNAT